MRDPPPSLQPLGYFPVRARQIRSTSDSPSRQRTTDDLLSHLTPKTALAAFRNPSGTLKECIDASSPTEQAFALRTAVASEKIFEWLQELTIWPWPAGGSSAPFEPPTAKRRRLSRSEGYGTSASAAEHMTRETYMGSFLAADVVHYLERIDEISQAMEQLDLDEIKSHVLYNHILPLSQPGTPLSDTPRAMASLSSYNRMDDLTALVTATIVQALPNLSRLHRLINAWTMRLIVLKKTSSFLSSLEDTESALRAAHAAIESSQKPDSAEVDSSSFSRKELDIMKSVLDVKVSRAGRYLDSMLDALESGQDTLPEHWIDRMDAAEQQYVDWVTRAERKVSENTWAEMARTAHNVNTSDMGAFDGLEDTEDQPSAPVTPPNEPDVSSIIEEEEMGDISEPELPLLPRPRRGSNSSADSTIIHGSQIGSLTLSSDPLDQGTPDLPRYRNASREVTPADDDGSPSSSPPAAFRSSTRSVSVSFMDIPTVTELPEDESTEESPGVFSQEDDSSIAESPRKPAVRATDDQLQQQISEILQTVPAKIRLTTQPPAINLNPPDFKMPVRAKAPKPELGPRSHSSLSTASSRAGTPSFLLAPAFSRTSSRQRNRESIGEAKVYHLSRADGQAPIRLLVRCVGENGERVMVRVGGGWADLGEYLKEYASHHSRRSGKAGEVEVKDLPRVSTTRGSGVGSSPASRPASALDSPITPLHVRKSRKSVGEDSAIKLPKTPLALVAGTDDTPSSEASTRSRSSSRLSWTEEDVSLGMAGPRAKQIEMSDESKAWVESVKEKVRIASSEHKPPEHGSSTNFGEIGKVGGTRRLFKRQT